ncbi:S41 family peptidase [Pedobacter agri]|nr:S41 family peptidase [Pedobacter agri]MDQ1142778.1 carboxyl-terminal processing protease [Pedobacter agri]
MILFNNMTDFKILKSAHLKNYKLLLPFDQKITEIKWGIYIKGMGQLEARNISLKVDEGEFSNKWKIENIQNWSNKTNKLFVDYAKLWGFLKYFHPKNSLGKINWDSVLVRHIDNLISSKTQSTLDLKIEEMLATTGGITACDSCSYKIADSLKLNYTPPLEDLNISSKNLKHLRYILKNFRKVNSYHVQTSPRGTPNPSFVNEAAFSQMELPDVNYRLLTLIRYWNIINYFYPYKYTLDDNWQNSLSKLIPMFVSARTKAEYHKAVLLMSAAISDSHASTIKGISIENVLAANRQSPTIILPMSLVLKDGITYIKDIDSSFAEKSNIRRGARILSVNNTIIDSLVARLYTIVGGSNKGFKDSFISRNNLLANSFVVKGKVSMITQSELKKNETLLEYNMKDYIPFFRKVYTYKMPNFSRAANYMIRDSILYIDPSRLDTAFLGNLSKTIESLKTVIVDFRPYPKYQSAARLLQILSSNKNSGVKFQWMDLTNPGVMEKPVVQSVVGQNKFKGRVIVLVDEQSLSQSEFWAMQYRKCTSTSIVVGRPTAGADGDISEVALPGNLTAYFSGIRINYPDGSETQRIGIQPNIKVQFNIKDELDGRDTILEEALKY